MRSSGRGHAFSWADELMLLRSETPLEIAPDALAVGAQIRVAAGERVRLSLGYVKGDIGVVAPLGDAADARMQETDAWWT